MADSSVVRWGLISIALWHCLLLYLRSELDHTTDTGELSGEHKVSVVLTGDQFYLRQWWQQRSDGSQETLSDGLQADTPPRDDIRHEPTGMFVIVSWILTSDSICIESMRPRHFVYKLFLRLCCLEWWLCGFFSVLNTIWVRAFLDRLFSYRFIVSSFLLCCIV